MTYLDYTTSNDATPLVEQKPYVPYNRSLVYGIGVNDHPTPVLVDGKIIKSYDLWHSMLGRCYSANCQKKQPTYIGCSVVEEWHLFSNFERWFSENYFEGAALDKDILNQGNKVYGPDTCVFIPRALNNLLLDHRAARGEYPLGVIFRKSSQKYIAQINTTEGHRHLGCFTTALEAHKAWQLAKIAAIEAAETNNPRVRVALDRRAAQLKEDHANGRITIRL